MNYEFFILQEGSKLGILLADIMNNEQ